MTEVCGKAKINWQLMMHSVLQMSANPELELIKCQQNCYITFSHMLLNEYRIGSIPNLIHLPSPTLTYIWQRTNKQADIWYGTQTHPKLHFLKTRTQLLLTLI